MHRMIAKERAFPSAKAVKRHRHRNRNINADHTSLHATSEVARRIAVASKQRSAIPILVLIHKLQRSLEIIHAHNPKNRPEDFFSVNPHLRLDVVEQACPQEESFTTRQHTLTTVNNQFRAFFTA